jgi:DnaJ-class molecular chaperone
MSIFDGPDHNRGNECQTCRGTGVLRVEVLDWHERSVERLPDVICAACGGKGRFATAASEAAHDRLKSSLTGDER